MIMHFMWPFIFAISNALFPSTWKQHSSGYELKVVAIGLFGVWFLMQSGIAIGEHSALGLGKAALMLAALASAIFGGANAVFDDHALARSRARRVELLQAPELPVTFRYSALQIRFLSGLVAMLLLCLGSARDAAAAAADLFWRHFGSRPDRAFLARLRRLFRGGFLF